MRAIWKAWQALADGIAARQTPQTADEWAERHIVLPDDSPYPGPFRLRRMELQREPLRAMSPGDPCRRVTIKAPAQGGKSTILNAALGFYADAQPAAMALYLPRDEDVSEYQNSRLRPLWASSDRLRAIVGKTTQERRAIDNAAQTDFATGARLFVRGANSPSAYRSDPLRITIQDDADAFRSHPEGDHVKLAQGRTTTYNYLGRKVIVISSPGVVPSLVEREYEASSQERYWVPCPGCGAFQVLEPHNLIWEPGEPHTARMRCTHGRCDIFQGQIPAMVREGDWRAGREERITVHRGFWWWQGYCPPEFVSWEEYAEESEESMRAMREEHDASLRKTFVTTRNARAWEPAANKKLIGDALRCYEQRESPWHVAELPILARTVSTDCQADRLESGLVGHGRGREAWALEYEVHKGDLEANSTWDAWCTWIVAQNPDAVLIDCGYEQTRVCNHLTRLWPRFRDAGILVYAVKNNPGPGLRWPATRSTPRELQIPPLNPRNGTAYPVSIWMDSAIGWVYGALNKQPRAGEQVLHIQRRQPFTRAWIGQIYTKRRRNKDDKRGRSEWVKPNDKARDEALDVLSMAVVALDATLAADPALADAVLGPVAVAPAKPREARARTKPRPRGRSGVF